jgi:23S rRNA pseudouridine1911/1915/1917 synthase
LKSELLVPREAHGARLDRFVTEALRDAGELASRAEVQRWISHGRVTVDGVARTASDKIVQGTRIVVDPELPARTAALPDSSVAFEIVYLDDDIVVVDKPAGLVVHPAKGHETGTLVNGLLARGLFRELGPVDGDDEDPIAHARPGIVHRIDRGTSGLLVVARTPRARESLKAQLAAHTVLREYEALCVGEIKVLRHATLYGRHPTDRMRFSGRVRAGKHAVTHVRVLERFGKTATRVVCSLETGRTHQIRVHLAESGTPILGDPLYGKPPGDLALRAIGAELGHQALHARLLGFVHPATGAPVRFEAALPADFEAALAAVRGVAQALEEREPRSSRNLTPPPPLRGRRGGAERRK